MNIKTKGEGIVEKEMLNLSKKISYAVLSLIICFLSGCMTKMVVTPQTTSAESVDFRLKGKVVYDGNTEYLPKTIIDDSVVDPSLTFLYKYDVAYGRDNTSQLIPLFNPLSIVGFPIGEDTIAVVGKLDILKDKEVIKSYSSTCGLEKSRNLFSEGESFSELRKKGLLAVRDNIEVQMYHDRINLSQLITLSSSQATKGEH